MGQPNGRRQRDTRRGLKVGVPRRRNHDERNPRCRQIKSAGKGKPTMSETPQQMDVSLEMFEGPLDLLLHLIKKNDLEIKDIPIAEITHEYLQYLDLMKDLNLEMAGEFLVMASTL